MGRYFAFASQQKPALSADIPLAADVISFWRKSSRYWFEKNPVFDAFFRDRYENLHGEIVSRQHDGWLTDAYGTLALLLLTDQYPRNAFRGTVNMYVTDKLAVEYARIALRAGYANQVEERFKLFFFLPFAHSEELVDQQISVAFTEQLGQPWSSQARHHMEIIRRFGRFPHRNEMLGRASTHEEMAFLKNR